MSNNWVAHLVWGALISLIPLLFIGVKYLQHPNIAEKVLPFEYFLHLIPLGAVINLFLMTVVSPFIKERTEWGGSWTNFILGALAGVILAFYSLHLWDTKISEKVWNLKKPENLYAYLGFYGSLAYGLVLPFFQRQVCLYGPRGY